jgi:hypothetical protein
VRHFSTPSLQECTFPYAPPLSAGSLLLLCVPQRVHAMPELAPSVMITMWLLPFICLAHHGLRNAPRAVAVTTPVGAPPFDAVCVLRSQSRRFYDPVTPWYFRELRQTFRKAVLTYCSCRLHITPACLQGADIVRFVPSGYLTALSISILYTFGDRMIDECGEER